MSPEFVEVLGIDDFASRRNYTKERGEYFVICHKESLKKLTINVNHRTQSDCDRESPPSD